MSEAVLADTHCDDPQLSSSEALDGFIESFLAGTFPKEQWRHRQHVIVATWHLLHFDEATALSKVRERIRRYNESQGTANTETSGYHETLTVFWIRLTADALAALPGDLPELAQVRSITERFGSQTGLFRDYYSFDVVKSVEARRVWVAPDLKSLPAGVATDPILNSEASLEAFIAAFLDCSFPGERWHHREHIIMAAWHLLHYPEAETIERIREAIKRYRLARGGANDATSGYHETLTLFWIRLAAVELSKQPKERSRLIRLFKVANELGRKTRLYFDYYNFDVLTSTPARLGWIEPDRRPLPSAPTTPVR